MKKRKLIVFTLVVILIAVICLFIYLLFFYTRLENVNIDNDVNYSVQNSIEATDADQDGLSDLREKEMGLNNLDFDTDGDGLSDLLEVKIYHSDPKKADTDGDGYPDGLELIMGFDPLGPGKLTQTSTP